MSAPEIRVKMSPDSAKVRAELRGLRMRLGDLLPFHKKASILLDRWVQMNFRGEGSKLSDGKWKPFKLGGRWISATPSREGYLDTSAKLLRDTGDLAKSHAPFYSRRNAGIGSWLPYAKAHHLGIGLPQRRTLPDNGEVNAELLRLLDHHAREAVNVPGK